MPPKRGNLTDCTIEQRKEYLMKILPVTTEEIDKTNTVDTIIVDDSQTNTSTHEEQHAHNDHFEEAGDGPQVVNLVHAVMAADRTVIFKVRVKPYIRYSNFAGTGYFCRYSYLNWYFLLPA